MDTIYDLVRFARSTEYDDIPKDAIGYAKMLLTDILACAAAGTTAEISPEVAQLMFDWGGKEESSALVYDKKLPAHHAAYLNSLFSHARDYDEFQPDAVVHTGISVIPSALAVAEAEGGISGKKLLSTIVLADELFIRMGFSVKAPINETGWIYSPTLGHFASALCASLLMGLDEEKTVSALGIAYAQVAGNQQSSADTTLTKRMQPGFAAHSGVLSAYLARIGVTGARNIIDGKYNYYRVYLHDRCDRSILTKDLGKKYMIGRLSYKLYPVCGMCMGSIGSTLKIMEDNNLKPEEIESIEIGTSAQAIDSCAEPPEVKFNPQTVVDAQFSIPFSVATVITKGKLNLADLTDEGIHDPEMLKMIKKVHVHVDEDIDKNFSRGVPPAEVTIKTTRGTFTANAPQKGHPSNPLTMDDMKEKFLDAMNFAVYPVKPGAPEKILEMIDHLEDLDDISTLIKAYNDAFIR